MAISEEEWEAVTEKVHPWDISDEYNNATDHDLLESLYELHDKAKKVIDPEYSRFGEKTNEQLLDFHDTADELQSEVLDTMNSLESIYNMLSKLTEAIPDSVYDEIDV